MEQPLSIGKRDAFRMIGFSDKVRRCVERVQSSKLHLKSGDLAAFNPMLLSARAELQLADDHIIAALHAKNPDILRMVFQEQPRHAALGFLAYLPLNSIGVEALVSGKFSGQSPNPDWITHPSEVPSAVYLWLVYLPGALAKAIGVIAHAFDELVPESCPVFSKAVNAHAERLNRSMGFLPAYDFYVDADPGLLVIFPEREFPKRREVNPYAIQVARTFEDMFKVLSIRSATYLAEQFCYFREEFDGNDFCGTHFLGHIDGDPAGCIRVRYFADFAKIERLAVRSEYRNSKLAFALARSAVEHCRLKGYQTIYGHSRLDLVRFWRVFGFREVESSEFSFASIKYREMVLHAERANDAIGLNSGPMKLIRPEGDWGRPGPLDISASENDSKRRGLIASRLRTVNGTDASV